MKCAIHHEQYAFLGGVDLFSFESKAVVCYVGWDNFTPASFFIEWGMEWNVEFIRWFGRLFHSFVCNICKQEDTFPCWLGLCKD
jgi:hypothetical protein